MAGGFSRPWGWMPKKLGRKLEERLDDETELWEAVGWEAPVVLDLRREERRSM